ncbi:MAG: hydrogenase maturation nickel metallochaperone HypA [Woeseia sp.]
MHELAICQALVDQVSAVAAAQRAGAVTDIYVRVGPLSGIEHPLMRNAFPVAASGTIAGDAELHLDRTPVRVRCLECGAETEASVNRLTCGRCTNWRTELISGDELLLERVILETNSTSEDNDV